MANQPKQRFVALRVHEVSLVDRPANEEEFLVIKRHPLTDTEKQTLVAKANQAEELKDGKEAEKNMSDKAKKKPTDAMDGMSDDDKAQLAAKGAGDGKDIEEGGDPEKLKNPELPDNSKKPKNPEKDSQGYTAETDLTKGKMPPAFLKDKKDKEDAADADAKKAKAAKDAEGEEDDASDDDSETTKTGPRKGNKDKGWTAESEQEMMDSCKALVSQISSFFDHPDKKPTPGGEGQPYTTTKAAGEEKVQKGAMDEVIMGMIYKLQDQLYKLQTLQNMDMADVEKAATKGTKHMTPTRLEKLKKVHGGLVELMKELQPPEDSTAGVHPLFPALVEGSRKPQENGNGYPGKTDLTDLGSKIAKSIEDALKPVAEQVSAVAKRLDAVEGIKGVSKALEADGNDEPVKKSAGFWTGIL